MAFSDRRGSSFDVVSGTFSEERNKSLKTLQNPTGGLMKGERGGSHESVWVCYSSLSPSRRGWLNIQFDTRWVFNSPDTRPEWAAAAVRRRAALCSPSERTVRLNIADGFQRHSTLGGAPLWQNGSYRWYHTEWQNKNWTIIRWNLIRGYLEQSSSFLLISVHSFTYCNVIFMVPDASHTDDC